MADYTISPARYAKNKLVIRPVSDGTGWKTRAMRLAEACGGHWVGRSGGYHVSKRQASTFESLYAKGWDASTIGKQLIPPKAHENQAAEGQGQGGQTSDSQTEAG